MQGWRVFGLYDYETNLSHGTKDAGVAGDLGAREASISGHRSVSLPYADGGLYSGKEFKVARCHYLTSTRASHKEDFLVYLRIVESILLVLLTG